MVGNFTSTLRPSLSIFLTSARITFLMEVKQNYSSSEK